MLFKFRNLLKLLVVALLFVFTLSKCNFLWNAVAEPVVDIPSVEYRVVEVIDGDTFWAKPKEGESIKIRLIGIDAPETRNVFKKKKHPFGIVSKNYLDSLLTAEPYIRLQFDVDSLDRYGRTLAYAFLRDGRMLNEHMLDQGLAMIMTLAPNVMFEKRFYKAQEKARADTVGIWRSVLSE